MTNERGENAASSIKANCTRMSDFLLSHCFFVTALRRIYFSVFRFRVQERNWTCKRRCFLYLAGQLWAAQTPDRRTKNEKPCLSPYFPPSIFSILFILIYLLVF